MVTCWSRAHTRGVVIARVTPLGNEGCVQGPRRDWLFAVVVICRRGLSASHRNTFIPLERMFTAQICVSVRVTSLHVGRGGEHARRGLVRIATRVLALGCLEKQPSLDQLHLSGARAHA